MTTTDNVKTHLDSSIIREYKKVALDIVQLHFPRINADELEAAVNWSINNRFEDRSVSVDNNYKKQTINGTLMEFTNYILDKKPIITSYGVMFSRHGTVPNPLYKMIDDFINNRGIFKDEMFKYPRGSAMYQKYDMLQLLAKLDANAIYGALGKFSCVFYNIYISASITTQGRSCNSAAALLFESILNNNVPFGSMNEMVQFIYNVKNQTREFNDNEILDRNITKAECFFQLMSTSGFGWIPTEKECELVWEILTGLDQTTINRLFYKNNLYHFCDNKAVSQYIYYVLQKLENPFMNPNEVPDEVKDEMDVFTALITEYVYYDQQIIDRLEKMESLIRSVSIIQDTDSAIISFDAWYRYVLEKTVDLPMNIKNVISEIDMEDNVTSKPTPAVYKSFDFLSDEIIEMERSITPDNKVIPQDGYRISIINIMAHVIGNLVIDYMRKYTVNSNSASDDRDCLIIMKNEFLFKRLLQIPDAKKNYASNMELQEGHIIPDGEKLDIKGIPCFVKSTSNETIRTRLKQILYDDILNSEKIDQLKVIKDLAIVEKEIFESIQRGEKLFFKPSRIKSLNNYDNPMRIQGIKASIAYNAIRTNEMDPIDLEARNSIDIIKVDVNINNVDKIKDTHPDIWEKMVQVLAMEVFDGNITAIALPRNETVPEWVLPFVKYHEIINDNIALFPLEAIGIYRGGKQNNYTNIVQF